jgi:hypothetical protein
VKLDDNQIIPIRARYLPVLCPKLLSTNGFLKTRTGRNNSTYLAEMIQFFFHVVASAAKNATVCSRMGVPSKNG